MDIEPLYIFLKNSLLFAIRCNKLPVVKKQHLNEAIGHGRHQKLVNGTSDILIRHKAHVHWFVVDW